MHRNPRAVLRVAAAVATDSFLSPAASATRQTLTSAPSAPALQARRALPSSFWDTTRRAFSSAADYGKDADEVNRKFAEAREEIEAAMDSKETVYFDEEATVARDAANEALAAFDALLARLPPSDADALRRSMGLKMEQLKAELKQLED
jgi:C-terminal processing protease CtpA/Prc